MMTTPASPDRPLTGSRIAGSASGRMTDAHTHVEHLAPR
jgi:hypothetical protein